MPTGWTTTDGHRRPNTFASWPTHAHLRRIDARATRGRTRPATCWAIVAVEAVTVPCPARISTEGAVVPPDFGGSAMNSWVASTDGAPEGEAFANLLNAGLLLNR